MANNNRRLALLTLVSSFVVASCGGGGGSDAIVEPPAPGPGDTRAAAATATANGNPLCSESVLGPFYWEIGDADGVKVSGKVGTGAPTATTQMWVFSSSKWLYAANVVQKRGVLAQDVAFLNFTSGYTNFGNAPICVGIGTDTVESCLVGRDGQNLANVGRFYYDSGHMQHHAAATMGLGPDNNTALAADLNATVGNFAFTYTVPQLAAGVVASPQAYAGFLRRMLRGELKLGSALGSNKVCADPNAPGCNAVSAPDLGAAAAAGESLNYSLGHWVEDDPKVGDHAFSSAGGGGFYPWIDSTKTYYGILARERETEADAGWHSAQCGRLIRQAWRTGVTVTGTTPTPTP